MKYCEYCNNDNIGDINLKNGRFPFLDSEVKLNKDFFIKGCLDCGSFLLDDIKLEKLYGLLEVQTTYDELSKIVNHDELI